MGWTDGCTQHIFLIGQQWCWCRDEISYTCAALPRIIVYTIGLEPGASGVGSHIAVVGMILKSRPMKPVVLGWAQARRDLSRARQYQSLHGLFSLAICPSAISKQQAASSK